MADEKMNGIPLYIVQVLSIQKQTFRIVHREPILAHTHFQDNYIILDHANEIHILL